MRSPNTPTTTPDSHTAVTYKPTTIDGPLSHRLEAEADELAVRIRQACQTMPNPPHGEMFEHVYVDAHPLVEREAAEFAAYQAGFED